MVLLAGGMTLHGAAPEFPNDPAPGVLNSFTGDVWINGTHANASSAGRATLETGQEISTHEGMAELLLTPGSFLRLGSGSILRLESLSASDVRLRLKQGRAIVEVLIPRPAIIMEQSGVMAAFQKSGLYGFDKGRGEIAVYSGEARLSRSGKQLLADQGFGVKTRRFREVRVAANSTDRVIAWSNLRSEQLSSESAASAQSATNGSGWHWDPWAGSYTWLSASGAVTGPFGWPYYSPGYVPNSIPVHRGDSYLYGPPVIQNPGIGQSATPDYTRPAPTVPLTAPGVPQFPNNKF
jgi:hypothetical protein